MATFIYAIIRDDNTPVKAVYNRELAFDICRSLAGVPVTFSSWYNGETSRVTHGDNLLFLIHCIQVVTSVNEELEHA